MWVDNAFPFDTYSLQCIHLLQSVNGLFIQSKRLTQMVIKLIMNLMIILGSDEDDDSYDFISKMALTHAMPKERLTTSPLGLTCHHSSNSIWIVGMIKMLKLIADLIKLETNVFYKKLL